MDARNLICANCAANITGQLYVVCTTCKQAYDLTCANIPEDAYHHRHKESWVCSQCKAGKHPPIGISSSSPDLETVPHPPSRDTADVNDISVIRQIVQLETTDLLQERLAAMISSAVTSQITPIIDNSMGKISERVAKIEFKIISLEAGRRRSVDPQITNPTIYIPTAEPLCPSPLCIPSVYEEEVYENGTIMSFREIGIYREDSFGGVRIMVRDELKSIMDQRITNMISLAVVDQIAPIMQISIGNLEGRIAAIEDKLKLLESSRRRNSIQTSSKADPRASSYPQTGFNSRANPEASNLQTGTSSRADPGALNPQTGTSPRTNPGTSTPQTGTSSKVDAGTSTSQTGTSSTIDPGASHSPSTSQNREKQNLEYKAPNDTSTNTDDSPYVDEVRAIIRDELSNVLTESLTKSISKAITDQIAPAIENSFGKLSGRVATIEERINTLESTPRVANGNVPGELRIAPQVSSDRHDGLDHLKNTSRINKEKLKSANTVSEDKHNSPGKLGTAPQVTSSRHDGLDHLKNTSQIDKGKLKSATTVSDDKDNGPSKLRSASRGNVEKMDDLGHLKDSRVNAENDAGVSDVEESNDSGETGDDIKNDGSSETELDEKHSPNELENSPRVDVDEEKK